MGDSRLLPKLEKSVLWNLIIRHWTSKLVDFLQDIVSNFLYSLQIKSGRRGTSMNLIYLLLNPGKVGAYGNILSIKAR